MSTVNRSSAPWSNSGATSEAIAHLLWGTITRLALDLAWLDQCLVYSYLRKPQVWETSVKSGSYQAGLTLMAIKQKSALPPDLYRHACLHHASIPNILSSCQI